MAYYVTALEELIDKFRTLPNIGAKTAQRLAFAVLKMSNAEAEGFAAALLRAKKDIHFCPVCQNLTDKDLCSICSNPKRDRSIICVVEGPSDVLAIEKTGKFNGLYHVLHGTISPMENVGPGDIKLKELIARLSDDAVKELIIATNPTVDGDTTAMYISRILKELDIVASRLAFGIPIGGELEYSDSPTLSQALENRRVL